MEIRQDFIPQGRRNRPGYKLQGPRYITVHDTGNPGRGAGALAHARYLQGETAARKPVSWHFTVDDRYIIQHLPLDEVGWHAGDGADGPGNRSSIGVEICQNSDGDRAQAEANAAWLVADLLRRLGLPAAAVVQHHRWTGKGCPNLLRARPEGWEGFLASVERELAVQQPSPGVFEEVRRLTEELQKERAASARLRATLQEVYRLVREYGA